MTKDEFYLSLAEKISEASKCLRSHFGVVIIKNDMVIGTGYNGPARGVKHCDPCHRKDDPSKIDPSGFGWEKCIAIHAEANAIIQAGGRAGCLGATMYIGSHNKQLKDMQYNTLKDFFPCNSCGRFIIQAGIMTLIHQTISKTGLSLIISYDIPLLVKGGFLV